MKPHRLFAFGVALMCVGNTHAVDYLPLKAPPSKSSPAIEKKKYELPTTGKNIPRQKSGWFNAEGTGTRFVVKFFDKEKKPVPPDVVRGFACFNYAVKDDTHAPLNREGQALVTPATVKPPHNFLVILTLFSGETAEAVESYTFKYP